MSEDNEVPTLMSEEDPGYQGTYSKEEMANWNLGSTIAIEEEEYDSYDRQVIANPSNSEVLTIVDTDEFGKPVKRTIKANTSTEISRLKDREEIRKKRSYILDKVMACGRIHALAGPSGAGKTTWLAPFIKDWSEGKEILGYKSNPKPYLYISCDRSGSSLDETLSRLKLDQWDIHYKTIGDIQKEFGIHDYQRMDVEDLIQFYPNIDVFFIEAIGWFQKLGSKTNQYADNLRYWTNIARIVDDKNKTILGTLHCPKSKPNDRHDNPRERVIGSVAMGAVVDSIFLLEFDDAKDITNKNRVLRIMARNVESKLVKYRMGEGGTLVEMTDQEIKEIEAKETTIKKAEEEGNSKKLAAMNSIFLWRKLPERITMEIIIKYAEANGVSKASAYRWKDHKLETRELIEVDKGIYKRGVLN